MKKLLLLIWRMSKADLRLLWFAFRHPDCPKWLFPAIGGLVLYALAPFNLVIPLLGAVDDLVLVPLALHGMLKLLPPAITQGFADTRRMSLFA
jgi:uncharacterized membrane protein YkvA (DUF1232 family)